MTWRTAVLTALLVSLFVGLLVYLLVVTTWRAVDEGAPPDPRFVAASAGRAFIADMHGQPTTTTTVAPTTTTTAKPVVRSAPKVVSRPAPARPVVHDGSVWDRLARCESGGNWSINTGNGYFGGLQFALSSWRAVGGQGYPHQASREEQISRAVALKGSGPFSRHWPACSRKLGLG